MVDDAILRAYLPHRIRSRVDELADEDHPLRLRALLLLWTLGYQIDHAWFLAVADDATLVGTYEGALELIDDDRLIEQLEATSDERGDGGRPFASSLWLRGR